MEDDLLRNKIRRIYAALDACEERDMSKLPARVIESPGRITLKQDFSGGASPEELENDAHTLIHNIANIEDVLLMWAKKNGHERTTVLGFRRGSEHLQVLKDLSNADKHGWPPWNDGHSGLAPRLTGVHREMILRTQPKGGSTICITQSSNGSLMPLGDGEGLVVTTADIIDRDGRQIGSLHEFCVAAIEVWESALAHFGISI